MSTVVVMLASEVFAGWLRGRLSGYPPGRLPSIRTLAASQKVGSNTVLQALRLLEREGLVEFGARSGVWRAGERLEAVPAELRTGYAELVARLVAGIRVGKHPWEIALPSSKELARLWSCHPQTAAKVLRSLCHEGMLVRRGRSHFPVRPRPSRRHESPCILCYGAPSEDGSFRIETDRELDFWRDLGLLAAEAGLSLVREPWQPGVPVPTKGAVGIVASTWHHPEPSILCRDLEKVRMPVCVWIEEHTLESGFRKDSRLRFHEQGYSTEIGTHVARHLFDLGHRHVAYISPWHSSRWSRNRLRGVQEEADRRGGTVGVYTLEGESDWDHIGPARDDAALGSGFPATLLSELIEGDESVLREMSIQELAWNRIRRDTVPLLEQALASGATAWIGANDKCALQILGWLRSCGTRVPHEVSVAGFDDTAAALRADLTSFRFSSADMARSMIRQILSSHGMSSMLTRHEGVVVRRGSTAPPPR